MTTTLHLRSKILFSIIIIIIMKAWRFFNEINPRAGQRLPQEGAICGRECVWFHLIVMLCVGHYIRLDGHPPSPPTPTPSSSRLLIGRGEAAGTESALSWWPGLCSPHPSIKARGRSRACQMDCHMRFGVTSGFDFEGFLICARRKLGRCLIFVNKS